MRAFTRGIRIRAVVALLAAAIPLLASACSSDPAGVDDDEDGCRAVGVLLICGADTTRVEGD